MKRSRQGSGLVEIDLKKVGILAIIVLALLALLVLWLVDSQNQQFKPQGLLTLRAVIINVPECADCFDTGAVIADVQSRGANVTIREYFDLTSSEAKKYIRDYNVTKAPVILLFGEGLDVIEPYWAQQGEKRNDALVLTRQKPVYIDLSSGQAVGRVRITTILPKDCPQCGDLSEFISGLKANGVVIASEEVLLDSEAQQLISRYGIKMTPMLILSPEAQAYDFLASTWKGVGSIESDGSLILRSANPPFYDEENKTVRGLVRMTIIRDSSCAACYDASIHKEILSNAEGIAMDISSVRTIEASSQEGNALIGRYEIDNLPTFIIDGDVSVYQTFVQIWPQVGTHDGDAYVFRRNDFLEGSVYLDVKSNKTLVGAAPPS